MTIKLANNVSGFLNTAITASDTGIVLQSGNGASFPALGAGEYFYATLVSTGNTLEVVKVTARSGDSMTVVRAQDGTSAASFAAGSRVEIRVTVASVRDAISDVATASAIGFTPVGGISATNVQAAIAELDSEAAKSAVLAAAGGAALIGNTPAGTIAATNMQSAINEIVSDLAVSSGSSLVGFLQAGLGAVVRTAQSKMRDVVSVKDFGAVGDGVADDTVAIQAACTAAKTITFGSSADNYRVTGTTTLTSGTTLLMQGASITQATDQTPIFNAASTDNVTITGGRFVGKSEASYTNSPSSQAICIKADNATDLLVTNNRFENFWYSPLMINVGGNRIEFSSNSVKGPGAAVLGVDINRRNTIGCTIIGSNVRVSNNDIYDTATGVIIGQGSTEIVVDGNVIHDLTNEHGIYADTGIRRLTISNNVIRNTGANGTGMKVQCYDSFGVEPQCVAITGNSISNTGGDAIAVINVTTGSPTLRTVGVTIAGNTIQNAGAYGIDAREVNDCVIIGNEITTAVTSGIAWQNADNILIIGNVIRNSALSGIRDLGPSTNVTIKDNVVRNCATANGGNDEYGILINDGGVNHVIDGNIISDANANMQYGIFVIPNINSSLSITGNTVMQSTDAALRLGSTTALREYRRNNWIGTLAATFNDPVLPVVASAATITLPTAWNAVSISGTTNITSIVANGHSGRLVTLYFQDALTVVRGSNLILNQALGSFVTTANDTLTLMCDGTTWWEVSRSTN